MKRIVFLSTMALDANISLVKRLKKKYDLYFIINCTSEITNLFHFTLNEDVVSASKIPEIQILSSFINLNKTYLVRNAHGNLKSKIRLVFVAHKLVEKLHPDVIITDAQAFTYIYTRWRFRNIIISFIHDPFCHSGENSLKFRIAKRMLNILSNRFVLFNELQKDKFISVYHINPNKVYTSFLSIYEFLYLFSRKDSEKDNSIFRILFFGRISPYKGISYLLQAVVQLVSEGYENIEVVIAGNGKYNFDAKEYKSYSQIKFINKFIETEDLAGLIQNSSVVVCPYTDATQSGVVMSAFAFMKPVLATRVGGLPEMLNHGETGMLIEPKSTIALHDALLELINNPFLLEQYSKKIEGYYCNDGNRSWTEAIRRIDKCINDLI